MPESCHDMEEADVGVYFRMSFVLGWSVLWLSFWRLLDLIFVGSLECLTESGGADGEASPAGLRSRWMSSMPWVAATW